MQVSRIKYHEIKYKQIRVRDLKGGKKFSLGSEKCPEKVAESGGEHSKAGGQSLKSPLW